MRWNVLLIIPSVALLAGYRVWTLRKQNVPAAKVLGLKYVPSFTTFLLIEIGRASKEMAAAILQHGVIVRPMAWMGFPTAIRVSIGTQEENAKFLEALGKILNEK